MPTTNKQPHLLIRAKLCSTLSTFPSRSVGRDSHSIFREARSTKVDNWGEMLKQLICLTFYLVKCSVSEAVNITNWHVE